MRKKNILTTFTINNKIVNIFAKDYKFNPKLLNLFTLYYQIQVYTSLIKEKFWIDISTNNDAKVGSEKSKVFIKQKRSFSTASRPSFFMRKYYTYNFNTIRLFSSSLIHLNLDGIESKCTDNNTDNNKTGYNNTDNNNIVNNKDKKLDSNYELSQFLFTTNNRNIFVDKLFFFIFFNLYIIGFTNVALPPLPPSN